MFKKLLILIPFALSFGAMQAEAVTQSLPGLVFVNQQEQTSLLARKDMSLAERYPIASVNEVFKNNILLTLEYMTGAVTNAHDVSIEKLQKPKAYEIVLQPGEVFAFHDDVPAEFANKKIVTTNAHFGAEQGFFYSGLYFGDGVCHLASLMNWTAREAGLKVTAPTNHNFAHIAGIAPEYGTAIYYVSGEHEVNQKQNLYIENTLDKPVKFVFTYVGTTLTLSIYK